MSEEDQEVTQLFEELRSIVDIYAGPGTDLSEVRRDVGMNGRAKVIRTRLRQRFGLTDSAIDRRAFAPGKPRYRGSYVEVELPDGFTELDLIRVLDGARFRHDRAAAKFLVWSLPVQADPNDDRPSDDHVFLSEGAFGALRRERPDVRGVRRLEAEDLPSGRILLLGTEGDY